MSASLTATQAPESDALCSLGATDLGLLYRSRELSPVEVVDQTLSRIAVLNPALNAYVSVLADSAIAAAKTAELQFAAGIDLGPLHGIPFSVKDIIRAKHTRTTAASRVLEDAPADQEDATVVHRLRCSGAILIGKTNLYEFAFGEPDADSPFGPVRNPRNLGRDAGGSSSGSAAAVTAGLGVISIGTDSGGSVRYPANLCGICAIKPTAGLVPVRGVIPLSGALDSVGPMARSVADLAACLATAAGHDARDPYSVLTPVEDYVGAIGTDIRGLRMGVPLNRIFEFGPAFAHELLDQARATLVELGVTAVPMELPRAEEGNDIAGIILNIDFWNYHHRHSERKHLYGRPLMDNARPGLAISGLEYARAIDAQREIRHLWRELFERVDVIALPGSVAGAPRHGEDEIVIDGQKHGKRWVNSRFNRIINLAGLPSLALPIGQTPDGMPLGMQLVARPFGERTLFAVGHALEQALGQLTQSWGIEPRTAD